MSLSPELFGDSLDRILTGKSNSVGIFTFLSHSQSATRKRPQGLILSNQFHDLKGSLLRGLRANEGWKSAYFIQLRQRLPIRFAQITLMHHCQRLSPFFLQEYKREFFPLFPDKLNSYLGHIRTHNPCHLLSQGWHKVYVLCISFSAGNLKGCNSIFFRQGLIVCFPYLLLKPFWPITQALKVQKVIKVPIHSSLVRNNL